MVGIVLGAGAWGCALIVGVDFDAARSSALKPDPGSIPEGGTSPLADGGCPPDKKACNGACVQISPEFGCGGPDCTPCSLATTMGVRCDTGGACVPSGCAQGFDDCDKDPANGCETDLSRKESCGACGKACPEGTLCAPGGCVSDCPGTLVACGGSCVDTTKSAAHCGGCNQACDGGANGDPACSASTCALTCRTGFADCTNNPAKSCAALPKWFIDSDGDGYGTAVFNAGCTKPAGHAANTGDCLDSNPAVHPGAASSDVPFAGASGPSYDYDCSGVEVEDNPPAHWAGNCGAGCNASGAQPLTPARAGAGVNNYCGSPTMHVCFAIRTCGSVDYDAGVRIKCN